DRSDRGSDRKARRRTPPEPVDPTRDPQHRREGVCGMTRTGIPQLLTDLIAYATQAIDGMDAYADAEERYRRFIRGSVIRDLIVIGEIATRLGTEFHDQHPSVPWRMIVAQRNVVAHGYDAI